MRLYLILCIMFLIATSTYAKEPLAIGFIGDDNIAHVTVNDKNVITLSSTDNLSAMDRASIIAKKLNNLYFTNRLYPEKLIVSKSGNQYVGKINNEIIFTAVLNSIDSEDQDSYLLALNWANNIRKEFGVSLLKNVNKYNVMNSLIGYASWYGGKFHGRQTASGTIYDINKMTAAHRYLPFGTKVLVTNINNGKKVLVEINDRGPFIKNRILDLSPAAFKKIGSISSGVMKIKLDVLDKNKNK